MSRIVEVALAVAGVVLYGGYKDIFVPPSIETVVNQEVSKVLAAPAKEAEPAQPNGADYAVLTLPVAPGPADALEDTARKQLEQFYHMPILDAPEEVDPEMAFVPDPSVEYSMPIVVPEPGIVAPNSPQRMQSGDLAIAPGTKQPKENSTPDAKPENE